MASATKVFETVNKKWKHARRFWEPQNDMYGRLLAFGLDLEHYRFTWGGVEKDRRRAQPKTQRQFSLIRHKASLLLRQPPQFDTHAVQPGADAHAAEVSRRIIEQIFYDPIKAYSDSRARMVISALAGARGCVSIEWHPKWGVCFRSLDPRRLHIGPGHTFLHSVFNPVVHEEVPMRKSDVLKMRAAGWNVPNDLNEDNWKSSYAEGGTNSSDMIGLHEGQTGRPGADEAEEGDGIVTVVKSWFREDPFARTLKKQRDADMPEDEWVWADDSMAVELPFDPTNPVPPISEATGQPLRLVTSKREQFDAEQYEDGYLVIHAPFYQGKKPLFEGRWLEGALNEDATLPSFPYMELVGYVHPLRRSGLSDTELTKDLVVVDNSIFRSTFEQISQAGGVLIAQKGKLVDSEDKPFRFRSAGGELPVAWKTDPMAGEVSFFQAPGMNPATPQFNKMIADQWQHIGTGDFSAGLGPERSKDIAVGTANLIQQSGDLPVQLHGMLLAQQEAIGAAVALGFCRAYMGDNVVSWVTDEGDAAYAVVRGADLVPLNVTVRADKEWRQQDVDRVQATAQLLGMAAKLMLPPPALAALLKDAGLSASVVTALIRGMGGPPGAPAGSAPPVEGGPAPPELSLVEGGAPQ